MTNLRNFNDLFFFVKCKILLHYAFHSNIINFKKQKHFNFTNANYIQNSKTLWTLTE